MKHVGVRDSMLSSSINHDRALFTSQVISLTVSNTFPGKVVLFVMLVMGWLGGSFGLPPITTTTATTMAAVARKTTPADITTLWFFLSQPGTSSC
jgi:hypothetical protein